MGLCSAYICRAYSILVYSIEVTELLFAVFQLTHVHQVEAEGTFSKKEEEKKGI